MSNAPGDDEQQPGYPNQAQPSQAQPSQPYPVQPYPGQQYPAPPQPGQYPGQPYPYPPYGYPYRPSTNGFAIAGFVCSFFGLIGILGIVFSCIALGQIRQRGQAGKGLAIAGLVIGTFWACFYLVGLIIAVTN